MRKLWRWKKFKDYTNRVLKCSFLVSTGDGWAIIQRLKKLNHKNQRVVDIRPGCRLGDLSVDCPQDVQCPQWCSDRWFGWPTRPYRACWDSLGSCDTPIRSNKYQTQTKKDTSKDKYEAIWSLRSCATPIRSSNTPKDKTEVTNARGLPDEVL